MGLETFSYINSFVATNPANGDTASQGDDHIRGMKAAILLTFPGITGAVTMTHTQLNTVTARGLIAGQTWTGTHTFGADTYGVTAAPGSSGTAYATLDYANNLATSAVLPGLTGNEWKILTTTDGLAASFSGLLNTGVIRIADTTDITKLISFDLSGLTTATTRTVTFGDRDVDLGMGYLKLSDQKASGTNGGSSVAADITQTRDLNTVEVNTIPGASLAANVVTLPAGTYRYQGRAPHYNGDLHKAFLYNATDTTYTGIGANAHCVKGGATGLTDAVVRGQFTIAAQKTFTLRHFTSDATATNGLGLAVSSGQVEVYSELEFWKVG